MSSSARGSGNPATDNGRDAAGADGHAGAEATRIEGRGHTAGRDVATGSAAERDVPGIFSGRLIGLLLTIGSVAGLLASFQLINDAIHILENPDFTPGCNFSILMSCKSVIMSEQGHVFGFKNPIAGLAGFGILLAIGVAMLARVRFPRWYMVGATLGLAFAAGWVQWFAFQTIFRIEVLCPWCMVVWTVTIPMFWYTLLHTIGRFTTARWVQILRGWHLVPVVLWYLAVVTLILVHFWDYYWADFFARTLG